MNGPIWAWSAREHQPSGCTWGPGLHVQWRQASLLLVRLQGSEGVQTGERSLEGYSVFPMVIVTHLNVTLGEETNSKNDVTNIKTWNDAL